MAQRPAALSARADATRACTFCPKLCRPACPAATVTGNDAISAWGIMSSLHPVADGHASASAESLRSAYACTGCGHCRSHCELDVAVPDTVTDARVLAQSEGHQPASIARFVAELPQREERVRVLAQQLAPRADAPSGLVLFAGCTLVATSLAEVAAAQRAMESLAGPATLVADLCCGAPWLDAGDLEGFRARAEALSDRLRRASTVVTLDSGCAHTMNVRAAQRGVNARSMETFEQYFLKRIDRIPAGALARMGTFAVHDSCRAGRGLGLYDAPRTIIERLTGRAPIELAYHHERSLCSGGGGLLPVSNAAVADAISDELAALVRDAGADNLLTSCPTSKARLARRGIAAFTMHELFCELGRAKA